MHGRLYLGQSRDRPNPRCQFTLSDGFRCTTPDSMAHFARECQLAREATEYLKSCFTAWDAKDSIPEQRLLDAYLGDLVWTFAYSLLLWCLFRTRSASSVAEGHGRDHSTHDTSLHAVLGMWKACMRTQLSLVCANLQMSQDKFSLGGKWLQRDAPHSTRYHVTVQFV